MMKKVFWGAFFIFLNFYLTLGSSKIGLIPTFVGYILLISGMNQLRKDEECIGTSLNTTMIILKILTVISIIDYILALIGFVAYTGWFAIIWMLALTIASCYCWIKIIGAIVSVEKYYGADLNGKNLLNSYKCCVIMNVVTIAAAVVQDVMFSWVIVLFTFVAVINFLLQISRSRKRYEELDRTQRGTQNRTMTVTEIPRQKEAVQQAEAIEQRETVAQSEVTEQTGIGETK